MLIISLSLSQCDHNITFASQDMRGPGLVELVAEHPSWVNNQIFPFEQLKHDSLNGKPVQLHLATHVHLSGVNLNNSWRKLTIF